MMELPMELLVLSFLTKKKAEVELTGLVVTDEPAADRRRMSFVVAETPRERTPKDRLAVLSNVVVTHMRRQGHLRTQTRPSALVVVDPDSRESGDAVLNAPPGCSEAGYKGKPTIHHHRTDRRRGVDGVRIRPSCFEADHLEQPLRH